MCLPVQAHLHSNMDRLKLDENADDFEYNVDLHSNMDRLKQGVI